MLYTIQIIDPESAPGNVWATNDESWCDFWNGLSWTRDPSRIGLFTAIQVGHYIERINRIERALIASGRCHNQSSFRVKRVRPTKYILEGAV